MCLAACSRQEIWEKSQINATFVFDIGDYKAVTYLFPRRYGIKTVDDILSQKVRDKTGGRYTSASLLQHTRVVERRCRMYTPDPRSMQANKYITDTEPLEEHYTYELRKYLLD
jgi:hypothetical protein